MSTTQGIDARSALTGWTNGLIGMYTADINAIPDDKWTATFGGCTRSANELTADALGLMYWCTGALKGEAAGGGDYENEMKELVAKMADKSVAIAMMKDASEKFCAALAEASDEALNTVITPPWQMPAPLFILAQITASHLWYHDGQLNYIQCLLGDDKIHWMGD